MARRALSVVFCGLLLSGCAALTHTPYTMPSPTLPAAYDHADAETSGAVQPDPWWQAFEDPALDALVDAAMVRNPDLAAAAVRVRRATVQARRAGVALLPIPNGTVSTSVSRPLSGADPMTSEAASGSLGVTWELDLFGRVAAEQNAAAFEARATEEDRDAAVLTLIGTVADLYWQIAFANERIAHAEQSLAYARRARALVETQYRAGAVSMLERREAEQAVATQKAAIPQLIQARTEAREALGVLLDGAPSPVPEPQALHGAALPPVPAGLPAELLGRRPDLRAVELRLRRTLARGDATRLSYYPSLSLTGTLGTSSTALLNVIANPVGTLGAGLTLPFLNLPAMRLDTQIAQTQYEEAAILFRKSLYSALAEVENALAARVTLAAQGTDLERSRDAAVDTERLYEVRYRAGAVPLRAWLDAQEQRRNAEIAVSTNRLQRLQNQIRLHQAIGGGFGTPPEL
jgi:NodT family efflux transporter outer membrane factor (OMF) lipoprotein